jgi:hypothetical protein
MLAPALLGGLFETQLGRLLVAIAVLAAVVLVGRVLLSVAWKILVVAGVVVAALYALSLLPL